MTDLAGEIRDVMPPDNGTRVGTVVGVEPLVVDVAGGLVPCGVLAPYSPSVGDSVAIIRQDGSWLCLGTHGPAAATGWLTYATVLPSGSTASATYATMTGIGTQTFVKAQASSRLRLSFSVSARADAISQRGEWQMHISGPNYGLGHFVARQWFNTAETNLMTGGHHEILGVPAGVLTLAVQWRRAFGAATLHVGVENLLSYHLWEA